MIWLSILISTSFANEIIVPAFAAAPNTDAAGPEIVYAALVEGLQDRDIAFLDSSDLTAFMGNKADDCPSRPECPGALWMDIQGELALVGSVAMTGTRIDATVDYYRRGVDAPVEVFQAEFAAAEANRFGVDAALIAEDLLKLGDDAVAAVMLGSGLMAPATVTEDALGPIGVEIAEEAPVVEEPKKAERPAPVPPPAAGRISGREMTPEDERRYLGLPKNLYEEFESGNQSRAAFIGAKRFRAKTFFVELSPSVVFGDVQRRYIARAMLLQRGVDDFETKGIYQRDQFLPGTAFAMVAGGGYAPLWWLELGVNVGLEFPRKELITGWEAYGSQASFEAGEICPTCSEQRTFSPATAISFMVEPRFRFVLVPTGPIKPFLVTAWTTRFNDAYETPDLDKVNYPDRPGVQSFGPTGGLGVSYDPRRRASMFLEGTTTKLLGPGVMDTGRQYIKLVPKEQVGTGMIVAVRMGVTSRF
jgi:hypothetical protein